MLLELPKMLGDNPVRTVAYETISSKPRGLSGAELAAFSLEGHEHIVYPAKRPLNAAPANIFQAFGNGPVNDRFRRKSDLSPFNSSFKKIADIDANLVPDALRDYDLIFIFYGNDGHSF
jgi:hypothetical protein